MTKANLMVLLFNEYYIFRQIELYLNGKKPFTFQIYEITKHFSCHFEVKEDFLLKFKSYPEAILKKHGKNYVNLKDIAKKQLEAARIKERNIEISPICTYCHSDKYFSFRKDKSRPVEAMIVIAGMPDRSC